VLTTEFFHCIVEVLIDKRFYLCDSTCADGIPGEGSPPPSPSVGIFLRRFLALAISIKLIAAPSGFADDNWGSRFVGLSLRI